MDVENFKKRKLDFKDSASGNGPPPKLPCQRNDDVVNNKMTIDGMVMEENNEGSCHETPVTEPNLIALTQRTGYKIVQENGQRKYGGPPPGWGNRPPPRGAEVFVGKIPRDVFEDELVPVFETAGKIYELRLMMEFDGKNRGYAFVMYYTKAEAKGAVKKLNNYEIRKGRMLGVCYSVDNCRLFVGGIPKSKKKDDILTEMNKVTEGVVDVIVYPSASDKTKNRGFAFVEYDSHRAAAMARRKLIPGRIQLWGHPIAVDWAEPEQEVDEDVMDQVKVLYVRNLMLDTTEDTLQSIFSQFHPGTVERVKKIRDYAFVHFSTREACMEAMRKINGTQIDGAEVEVTLAKPVDKNDYNKMAKVGAKVLNQGPASSLVDPVSSLVQTPAVVNQNGLVVYPGGVYGTDLTYYQLGQYNLAQQNARPIRAGVARSEKSRGAGGTRAGNNRSYLGYSAGKATYGRYYAKNNLERQPEANASSSLEIPYQTAPAIAESVIPTAVYKPNAGIPALAAANAAAAGQTLPQYAGSVTPTAVPQIVSTVPTVMAQKSSESILEEICQRQMWGSPTYQLHTTTSPDNRPLFLYKVSIPALASLFPQQPFFQPNKLSVTVEEAKSYAAEYVLSQLSLQADGSPAVQGVVPMATVIAQPPAAYQNVFAQPQFQLRTSPGAPPVAHPYGAATASSPTIPLSFVDPSGAVMQPITVMYQ